MRYSTSISVGCHPEIHAEIASAAKAEGISRSRWIIRTLLEKLRSNGALLTMNHADPADPVDSLTTYVSMGPSWHRERARHLARKIVYGHSGDLNKQLIECDRRIREKKLDDLVDAIIAEVEEAEAKEQSRRGLK